MAWPGEGWASPVVLAQDTLHMNESFSIFQPGYVEGSDQVYNCTAALRQHPAIKLMLMLLMMTMIKIMLNPRAE